MFPETPTLSAFEMHVTYACVSTRHDLTELNCKVFNDICLGKYKQDTETLEQCMTETVVLLHPVSGRMKDVAFQKV